jgi:serine/threonine protein kinase
MDEPVTNEVISGFRLDGVKPLGRGGFGVVWKGKRLQNVSGGDLGSGRLHGTDDLFFRAEPDNLLTVEQAAFKFLPLENVEAVVKEIRGQLLAAKANHPHVLKVYRIWEEAGRLIICMELADETLADCLQRTMAGGSLGLDGPQLLSWMAQAADALDSLTMLQGQEGGQNQEIVQHRDIKPSNLLLVDGCLKLGDFGLAKAMKGSFDDKTVLSTQAYAAPETFKEKPTSSKHSDQYSLALTYCKLRGGRMPYDDFNAYQRISAHLRLEPPDLSMLLTDPERNVVRRALDSDPDKRYPSCGKFMEALREATESPASVSSGETPTEVKPMNQPNEPDTPGTLRADAPPPGGPGRQAGSPAAEQDPPVASPKPAPEQDPKGGESEPGQRPRRKPGRGPGWDDESLNHGVLPSKDEHKWLTPSLFVAVLVLAVIVSVGFLWWALSKGGGSPADQPATGDTVSRKDFETALARKADADDFVPIRMAGYVNANGTLGSKVGAGFTPAKAAGNGNYVVTFDKAFNKVPVVLAASTGGPEGMLVVVREVKTDSARFELCNYHDFGGRDCGFHFIVIEAP